MRVLFVCSGNICRSPTAEAVLRARVEQRGLGDWIHVDSAGIGAWHVGQRPDPRARDAARARGVRLDGRARQVRAADFDEHDLILAMDAGHLTQLRRMAPPGTHAIVRMFTDVDVPDPYYGGESGFDEVLDVLEAGCARLVDELSNDGAHADQR
jgi:protein-tyrosine phosphatase